MKHSQRGLGHWFVREGRAERRKKVKSSERYAFSTEKARILSEESKNVGDEARTARMVHRSKGNFLETRWFLNELLIRVHSEPRFSFKRLSET